MKPFNLYPKNQSADLDPELFRNPTAEYRGTPFWSWNCKLDVDQLIRQIEVLKQMGLGGFHIHARTGLDTDYLGDEFMAAVKACAEKAEAEHMLAWLYDEDRWPSGGAGGLVTKDKSLRAKRLLFTPKSDAEGKKIGAYEVVLDNGCLASYRKLAEGEKPTKGEAWYAFLETMPDDPWYNDQAYVDTLSKKAIERFVEVTHERYKQVVGKWFGGVVPAIFTDEPAHPAKGALNKANERRDIRMPFTDDLVDTYSKATGLSLEDHIPELFWELPDRKPSLARYLFHDHVSERFASAFADTIGGWCGENGIALTGHMLEEPTLGSQTRELGDCMRSYRSFQLPGIDMLCDLREYTTAKQAQSAAHQYGRPGVLSELYGVTSWNYDFLGHKGQGDWQAALGVTVRVQHLSWVSMAGEAKRDYPASIHYQSPWWKEYPLVENHFSRVHTALTRGTPAVPVAVVHPVESYWLCYGPMEQTASEREEREASFAAVTDSLLFGMVDFNFVCESLLPAQSAAKQGSQFEVGLMKYRAVVVPGLRTIRSTTLDRLESFAAAGGKVIFMGEIPSLVDAKPSDRAAKLAANCTVIGEARTALLRELAPFRDLEVRLADGREADSLLYQMRIDGPRRRLFICNTDRENPRHGATIRVKGIFGAEILDTFTGEIRRVPARQEDGWTVIEHDFEGCGSLLLTLDPALKPAAAATPRKAWKEIGRLEGPVKVTLSEPNVLLLDQAEHRIGEEKWSPSDEVLRIGNVVRKRLGLRTSYGGNPQPWTDKSPAPVVGTVQLRYVFESTVQVDKPSLAVEAPQALKATLDGKPVDYKDIGYFVDESIRCMPLPPIGAGKHELVLEIPFTRRTELEWCYLLGDFGVQVEGRTARLTAPVRELHFGDWSTQGLPFYAGNVTYHCTLSGGGERALRIPWFGAPLLAVAYEGERCCEVAFPPYRADFGKVPAGEHRVDLTAFGNRANAFGPVHNCDPHLTWHGPSAWRTSGAAWSYEYQLKPTGILVGPMVEAAD